jgi:hypothetical protein
MSYDLRKRPNTASLPDLRTPAASTDPDAVAIELVIDSIVELNQKEQVRETHMYFRGEQGGKGGRE